MTHCLHYRIDALLGASDEDIEMLTEKPAKEARAILEEKKAAGAVYVPSVDCKGFNPATGCPGHP